MLLTNTGWLVSAMISIVFVILYPVVLAIMAHRRLQVSWRYFGYGALIFFLFQLITRIPLVLWLQNMLAPQLKASPALDLAWIVVLALTAGLTEEIGRYLGYRWFMKREEKTWNKAVMYGLGHGGFESMVFVGGLLVLTVINVVFLSLSGVNTLPESQRVVVEQQFVAINAAPAWIPLVAAWERLWTVPFHVGASVLILQVFQKKHFFWLWLAILFHATVDFVGPALSLWLGSGLTVTVLSEAWVTLAGLFSIWLIWRLRSEETPTLTPAGEVVPSSSANTEASQLEHGE
jgi:uncharacterized membrane protein YhfC